MNFAIVKFTEEEDSPGIIATNWLNKEKNCCFFPNVRSEEKKNKLLINRETPGNNWLQCPVKVLKEFINYRAARSLLSEAEETSNLDSSNESVSRSHKRKRRVMCLQREESSSDDDVIGRTSKRYSVDSYPAPPVVESFDIDRQSSQGSKTFNQVPQHLSLSPSPQTSERLTGIISKEGLLHSSSESSVTSCSSDIEQLKISQKTMWTVLTEFTTVAKQIQVKLDSLLTNVQDLQAKVLPQGQNQDEDISLLSLLPVGIDEFVELNNKIVEKPSFRQRLTKTLMTAGGRDCKALAANVLRKLISDDVGEKFSLTGKRSKTGAEKQSFENTEVYKLVLEICFRMFTAMKENVVREAVSDWLMQAKFRKSRREKRMSAQQVLPDATETE